MCQSLSSETVLTEGRIHQEGALVTGVLSRGLSSPTPRAPVPLNSLPAPFAIPPIYLWKSLVSFFLLFPHLQASEVTACGFLGTNIKTSEKRDN